MITIIMQLEMRKFGFEFTRAMAHDRRLAFDLCELRADSIVNERICRRQNTFEKG